MLTLFLFLLSPCHLFSQTVDWEEFSAFWEGQPKEMYIAGFKVNLRAAPTTDAEVIRQADWGESMFAIPYNEKWFKICEGSEYEGWSRCFYVYADFLLSLEESCKRIREKNIENGHSLYLQFLDYSNRNDKTSAENVAIKLINNYGEESILFNGDACGTFSSMVVNSVNPDRLLKETKSKEVHALVNYRKALEHAQKAQWEQSRKILISVFEEFFEVYMYPCSQGPADVLFDPVMMSDLIYSIAVIEQENHFYSLLEYDEDDEQELKDLKSELGQRIRIALHESDY